MNPKIFIFLLLLSLNLACQNENSIASSKEPSSSLSETSIDNSNLHGIIGFVESKISCKPTIEKKHQCWKNWLVSSAFDSISGGVNIPWSLKEQDSIFASLIPVGLKDSIWTNSLAFSFNKQDTLPWLSINFRGPFGKIYSEAAKNNAKWAKIWDSIDSSGEISPSLYSGLFHPKTNPLLSDSKMHLLMSIYLFTLNENHNSQQKLIDLQILSRKTSIK